MNILPHTDPLTRIRALADQFQRGEIDPEAYRAQFQIISDEVQRTSTAQPCEYRHWGRRCVMRGIVWRDGKLLCQHHGKRGGV